jgi:steroid delta-isomerase-like uncharacterized protein
MSPTNNLEVVKAWIDSYNKHEFDRAKGLLAKNAIHDWVPDEIVLKGNEAIVQGMRDVIKGFPDLITRITNSVVGDDSVVIEVGWTGTFKGEFLGMKPTGRSFELRAVFVIELENGKISTIREYYPSGLLNKQLGIG